MELGNVLMLPAFAALFALIDDYTLGWLTAVSMVPMCGLLLLGGFYWRAKLRSLRGNQGSVFDVMRWAHRLQWPFLVSSIAVVTLCILSWTLGAFSISMGDRITASLAAVLALLEYINYYHRQLQHFDNWSDFKRLLTGKGFRVAQMAADLRRYRKISAE